MSPSSLPKAYLTKTQSRLKALQVLFDDKNYSDVVCESQEIVELVSKALLRLVMIDPPHRHDVGRELDSIKDQFSNDQQAITELIRANHWLRREREMSYYGADDFDPTEGYTQEDAEQAFGYAELAVKTLRGLLG